MAEDIEEQLDELDQQIEELAGQGRHRQALAVAGQACELARGHFGEEDPRYTSALTTLAEQHRALGEHDQAESLYRRVSEIDGRVLGTEHPGYAADLSALGGFYKATGEYTAARKLYRQALEVNEKALGEDSPPSLADLEALIEVEQALGEREAARQLRQRLERLRGPEAEAEPVLPVLPPDPLAWQQIEELNEETARLYQQGRYQEAIVLSEAACDRTRRLLGEHHRVYVTSVNNLAGLYKSMGNYAAAELLYRQALELMRRTLGEGHRLVATSLNNLAMLYHSHGNYVWAEPLYRQALELRRRTLGEEHPDVATSLNNVALLCLSQGKYAEAEPLYRQALELRRRTLGEEHPAVAESLGNLAGVYHSQGRYAEAEPLYRQALELRRRALGEAHPEMAESFNNLAALYHGQAKYAEAEPLYRQALELWRRVLGQAHPNVAVSLRNLANLCAATGRPTEALGLADQAAAIDDRMIGQVFSIGSESHRMAYLRSIQRNLDAVLSLIAQYLCDSPAAVHAALDLVLRRKAVGAEALAAQRDAVLGGRYAALRPKLEELTALRRQVAQKALAGPGPEGLEAHRELLVEWNGRKERLEAELARQIPEMNLEHQLRAAGRQAVAVLLPEGSALVEFVRFGVFDFEAVPARGERQWRPARYLAFVLPAGQPEQVKMLDLGEAAPIDRLLGRYRAWITGEAESRGTRDLGALPETTRTSGCDEGLELRAALFDPLLPALGRCKRLFLAPDGDLTRLPFEVLPAADGRLLMDEYSISYLGAGRDVLRFRAASSGHAAKPVVAADPDFDLGGGPTVQDQGR
jgi:tetratricopeptide (TPR) repeat protein